MDQDFINSVFLFRGRELMVDFRVDQINLVIHVMHFGKLIMLPLSISMILHCLQVFRALTCIIHVC